VQALYEYLTKKYEIQEVIEMEFRVYIEGEIALMETIDEVIDHIQSNTYFEVDGEALRADLKHLRREKMIEYRENDCWIQRIR
jgi:hypothetical protein